MIQIYNRTTKSYEEELVAGKKLIEWTYESPVGKGLSELIIKKSYFLKPMVYFVIQNLVQGK